MQLFLTAPLIAYCLFRFKLKFLAVIVLAIVGSKACEFHAQYQDIIDRDQYLKQVYFPTHIRMSTWLVGIVFGYFVFHTRNRRILIPKIFNVICLMASLASLGAAIFTIYPLTQPENSVPILHWALYAVLSRLVWSIALGYIIFACIHGFGGPINWFLSLKVWQPFSRLSYTIYILHWIVIQTVNRRMRDSTHILEVFLYRDFFSFFAITVVVATLVSLAFESPIIALEKMVLRSKIKVKVEQTSN